MHSLKKRVYAILEKSGTEEHHNRTFDYFIMSLIILNIVAIILETVKSIATGYYVYFRVIEYFSVAVFTIEYILRFWVCNLTEKYSKPIIGRIKFVLSPFALIDLFAVLPFYLPMLIHLDLRFIRAVRLLRLLRILKIGRYSESVHTLGNVFKRKKEELAITVFIVFILLIIVSSLMYYIENAAQPNQFSSIPAAMWWGICTLTTIGYGDIYPVTMFGKLLGALVAVFGIGMFALPAGILGSGFVEEMQNKRKKIVCPYCKKEFEHN